MFIDQMKPITGFNQLSEIGNKKAEEVGKNEFGSIMNNALTDYVEAENLVEQDVQKLATGETNDTHNLMINAQKAELSLNFIVQMRNKVLESYQELMRTGV